MNKWETCSNCGYQFGSIEHKKECKTMNKEEKEEAINVGTKIEIIIPEEMWDTETGKKAIKEADKIIQSIEEFQKSSEKRKFLKSMMDA